MEKEAVPMVPAMPDEKAAADLEKEFAPILEVAGRFVVDSQASYEEAMRLGALCATYSGKWRDLFDSGSKLAHGLHKWFTTRIASKCNPLDSAKATFGSKAGAWKREEERRIAAERKAKEDAERKRIEEERLRQAEALQARGATKLADAVLEKPIVVQEQPKAAPIESAFGHDRERWVIEITDVALIPREYMVPDEKKLAAMARALKGAFKVPGVRAYNAGTTVFKSS